VAIVTPILFWRYGLIGGAWVLLPALVAVVVATGLIGWLGVPFTVFSAFGLILNFFIGLDYAIFIRESDRRHRNVTLLAVFVAGITTILSFGLLVLSSLPPVRGFGAVLLFGTITAIFLSPLAAPPSQAEPTR
jgi:predicted exporter